MTRRTAKKWLVRYAEAYMAFQMAGSRPDTAEQEEAMYEALREMAVAERRLTRGLRP